MRPFHSSLLGVVAGWLVLAPAALAQSQPAPAPPSAPAETRPATTTFLGDTGLWFVPTGEVLPARGWSVSGYRANFDRVEGFSDISIFAVTFGVGAHERVEVFGSFGIITRVDRDLRPIFADSPAGGAVNNYPLVRSGWPGNELGDLWLGAKVNLLSQARQQPLALALRGMVKLPTGADEVSTGKVDGSVGLVASGEVNQLVEVSGFGGVILRQDPDEIDISHGLQWGFGVAGPTRSPLRLFAELHGERAFDSDLVVSTPIVGEDGSVLSGTRPWLSPVDLNLGLQWQAGGVFVGAGGSLTLNYDDRNDVGAFPPATSINGFKHRMGFQARVGFHPGAPVYVAPPPPPAPPPAPPANRPPTVTARCEPCTVEVGQVATVTADAQDPEGDPLTYNWTAPTGTFANPADRQTQWTAPDQEGPVPVTVTVDDGRGGTASDTVTIQVVEPAVRELVFEDVHFDFDRYTLRPEATRLLDEVVTALQEDATLNLELEGHTCNIGTAEYNLALGERRAIAVRDYLTSRGIGADRLTTVSYGEERPRHDNSREETRRLNRRAALVVRLQ